MPQKPKTISLYKNNVKKYWRSKNKTICLKFCFYLTVQFGCTVFIIVDVTLWVGILVGAWTSGSSSSKSIISLSGGIAGGGSLFVCDIWDENSAIGGKSVGRGLVNAEIGKGEDDNCEIIVGGAGASVGRTGAGAIKLNLMVLTGT